MKYLYKILKLDNESYCANYKMKFCISYIENSAAVLCNYWKCALPYVIIKYRYNILKFDNESYCTKCIKMFLKNVDGDPVVT